jgi:hypothetical protein
MAGFALHLLVRQHAVTAAVLIDFIAAAFSKTVDKSWVARHMHALGFSSHRPAGRAIQFTKRGALPAAIAFAKETVRTLLAFNDKRRIVAMDQLGVWGNVVARSSYSPIGRCARM